MELAYGPASEKHLREEAYKQRKENHLSKLASLVHSRFACGRARTICKLLEKEGLTCTYDVYNGIYDIYVSWSHFSDLETIRIYRTHCKVIYGIGDSIIYDTDPTTIVASAISYGSI
jgi:hypothetical protein